MPQAVGLLTVRSNGTVPRVARARAHAVGRRSGILTVSSLLGNGNDRRKSGKRRVAGVRHALEEKARRGSRPFGGGDATQPGAADERFEIALGELARADAHEAADEAADHLPEEVRRGEADENERAVAGNFGALDEHARRSLVLRSLAEVREVVHPREAGRRPLDARDIERALDPPNASLREGRPSA